MRFRFSTLLLVLLWALPVCAQPPAAETTATIEHLIEDYEDRAIERKFLVLPDGTRVRIKGVNVLKTGDKVKVKKAKIRKLEKAKTDPALTEAEADAVDLVTAQEISSVISPTLPPSRPLQVIVATWSMEPQALMPLADNQTFYASIETRYRAHSFGALGFAPTTMHYAKIQTPTLSTCNYGAIETAARAVIAAAGGTIGGGHSQLVMQAHPACGWSGIAIVGGNWSVLNGSRRSAFHELGHNLGWGHSGFYACNGASCRTDAYGDDCDPMGQSQTLGHVNAYQKSLRNWIAPQTVTAAGTYALDPYETISSGSKALRLPPPAGSPNTLPSHYVEYRTQVCPGVRVHWGAALFDLFPESAAEGRTLAVGQSLLLSDGTGRRITTVSVSPTGATVRLDIGSTPPPTPTPTPTPPPTPPPPVPPPVPPVRPSSTAVILTLATSKTSVAVDEPYTLTVTAKDAHNVRLDGVYPFMTAAASKCDGDIQLASTICTRVVTKTPTAAGTVPHTVTGTTRTGAALPSQSVSITVTGATPPPPPPITPPPPPPVPPPTTAVVLTVVASKTSVAVGESYTLTVTARDAHVVKLDGAYPFMTAADSQCDGDPQLAATTCVRVVTKTPSAAGSVSHTVTGVTRSGAALPAQAVTVTVAGGTAPPPPAGSWQAIKIATTDASTFSGAADGNLICAVHRWLDCSDDQGTTWRAPLSINGAPLLEKPLAIKGQTVALTLVRTTRSLTDFFGSRPVGNVYVNISTDGGRTIGTPFQVSTGEAALRVSTAISTNAVWVVWMTCHNGATATACGTWDVYGRRFKGGSWGQELKLVSGAGSVMGAERPSIACSGLNCQLAWMDGRDQKPACRIEGGTLLPECTDIYGKFTSDEGDTWGADRRLTNSPHYAGRPSAEMDGADIFITFDRRVLGFPNDIGLLRSFDTSASFIESLLVEDGVESTHAGLAVNGSDLVAAWQGILVKRSSNRAGSWGASEAIVGAGVPAVGLTTNYAHVIYIRDGAIWVSRKARSTP